MEQQADGGGGGEGAPPGALVLGASQGPLRLKAGLDSLPFLPSTYCVPGPHWPSEGTGIKRPERLQQILSVLLPRVEGRHPRKRGTQPLQRCREGPPRRGARCGGVGPPGLRLYRPVGRSMNGLLPSGKRQRKTAPLTLPYSLPAVRALRPLLLVFFQVNKENQDKDPVFFRLIDSIHAVLSVCLLPPSLPPFLPSINICEYLTHI